MTKYPICRRRFLQGATAAAVPYVITSAALGSADTPPASERVALGHIGVGGQGSMLFFQFQRCKGCASVAVADAYKDRREARAAVCKGKAYADFRDVLARKDIDAVVIATPDHWHVPIAIAAARAKKDAYVEKPLGISIAQDLACRKVFAEQERVFQYGTMQRSRNLANGSDHCWQGCDLVRSGMIGKVHTIEVISPNGGRGGTTKEVPVPPNLDYDMWLGPAPRAPFTADRCHPPGTYWIYDHSIGYLAGWGAHPLDLMVWGCDADLAGQMTVEGTGEVPNNGLYNTVINWNVNVEMADGVKMKFKTGGDATKFIGTEGWIRISRTDWDAEPKSLLQEKIAAADSRLIHSANHYQNFVDAVKARRGAVSPLADAVRSDIISHLCDIAIRLKRKVTWDPKKEAIVGDAEASEMCSRAMRAPWTL
jgi:predicted dehydrogenase